MIWQVIGASVPGTGHIQMHLPCQDAFKFHISNNCAIAAVADGLGSVTQADKGSRIAVESALKVLTAILAEKQPVTPKEWERVLFDSFEKARQAIEHQAKSENLPIREFGTTLIVVAVTPNWLSVGHIGDGAVVALIEEDQLLTISPPQQGEYANETISLTRADALKFLRCQSKPFTARCVAIMTDGLQNLSINLSTATPYLPFFAPFFEAINQTIDTRKASQQLADFLYSERICERTSDDKTLVIIGGNPNIGE